MFLSFFVRLLGTHVISASKQVVSGILYRVNVSMAESDCLNTEENKNKKFGECAIKQNGATKECKFTLWSRPWMKKFGKDWTVTAIHC